MERVAMEEVIIRGVMIHLCQILMNTMAIIMVFGALSWR